MLMSFALSKTNILKLTTTLMKISNSFSSRLSLSEANALASIHLSQKLRSQIIRIIQGTVGKPSSEDAHFSYEHHYQSLCDLYDQPSLHPTTQTPADQIFGFIEETQDNKKLFDLIEYIFRYHYEFGMTGTYEMYCELTDARLSPDKAVEALNDCFAENNIPYVFQNGHLFRTNDTKRKVPDGYLDLLETLLIKCKQAVKQSLQDVCTANDLQYLETDTIEILADNCYLYGFITADDLQFALHVNNVIDKRLAGFSKQNNKNFVKMYRKNFSKAVTNLFRKYKK